MNRKRQMFLFTNFFKKRTFGDVWISMLKVHENIGNQRIKFAASISDSAEDLLSLGRNIEKDRKKVNNINIFVLSYILFIFHIR